MRRFLALLLVVVAACDGDPSTTTAEPAEDPNPSPAPGAPPAGPLVAAVYTSDYDLDGVHELYAIDTVGGVLTISHGVGDGHHVMSFALSADERTVAFAVDNGGLFVSPVNENAPRELSPPGLVVEEFAWAPDGSKLAYRATASPGQLYLVNPDGTGHTNVTGGVGEVASRVRWSFDGAWLAFHWDREVAGQQEVHVVRPDGSDLRRITMTAADPTAARYVHFSWSPTANCLALRTDPTGSPGLYIADVDAGTPPTRLSTGDVEPDRWEWSSDGSALAYRHPDPTTQLRAISIVSKQGGDDRQVSGDIVVSAHAWSPDGTRVAFRDSGSLHVTDGASPSVELARAPKVGDFTWSPAGDRLAYLTGDLAIDNLWTVDMQGGAPTFVGEDVLAFAWDPPSQLAQGTDNPLRVVRNTSLFGLTLAIAGVWDFQEFRRTAVLAQDIRRAHIRYRGGRVFTEAQVFIGGNAFVHSLSADDALALSVGLNAVIVPLAQPVAASAFEGFVRSLDATLSVSTGSFPAIWLTHRNAEAQTMSFVEWIEIFGGQVAPQVYVSIGAVPDGSNLDLDVQFNGVGFAALADLSFAPEIVAVSVLSNVRSWIASGVITESGSDVKTVVTHPRPRMGDVLGPTLYTRPDLNEPSGESIAGGLVDVWVLAETKDAVLIEAFDGTMGWVAIDEVDFDD